MLSHVINIKSSLKCSGMCDQWFIQIPPKKEEFNFWVWIELINLNFGFFKRCFFKISQSLEIISWSILSNPIFKWIILIFSKVMKNYIQ